MLHPDKTSVSNLFTTTEVDNISLLDIWTSWQLTTDIIQAIKGEGEVIVTEGDSWHSISEQMYGTREYWWVLALYNNVDDPFALFFESSSSINLRRINVIRPEEISLIVTEVRKIRVQKEVENA